MTTGAFFESEIDRLAQAGITLGCNPPANDQFCPLESVTRAQMATFLDRALDLPSAPAFGFTDIDTSVHRAASTVLPPPGSPGVAPKPGSAPTCR